jgi:hypothetical protein
MCWRGRWRAPNTDAAACGGPRSALMPGASMKKVAAVLGVCAATWLAIVLVCYGLLYKTVYAVYDNVAREILQVRCGRIVSNELIYTLEPGSCRFGNAEFETVLDIDRDGFRNSTGRNVDSAARVVVIGDSYAMGWGIGQDETFASLIARDRRYNVRNLAMSSYGTARELFALQRFAPDAEVVILQYTMNDLRENAEFLKDPAAFVVEAAARAADYGKLLETYRNRPQSRQQVQHVADMMVGHLAWSWRLLHLPPRRTSSPTPQRRMEEEARAFAAVMSAFRSLLEGKTVIVLDCLPRMERENFAPTFRKSLDAAGFSNIRVIDLVGVLRPGDYYHLDDHLRASGHAAIAERVLAELGNAGPAPAETPRRAEPAPRP